MKLISIMIIAVLALFLMAGGASAAPAADGDGTMTVSPTSVTAGSTSNSFTFTFTGGLGNFGSGAQVTIIVPSGWTAPQSTTSSSPGYVSVALVSCGSASLGTITGSGPWTIPLSMNCNGGKSFTVTYAGGGTKVTAPNTAGSYTFTTQTKISGGTLTNIASSPTITVTPTTASKLAFTSSAVTVTAGVASSSITVQRQDQYGNPVTAESTRTVTLTSTSSGTVTFNPTSLSIASGSSTASFTYTDTKAGTPTITAASTSPSTITSAMQQETVNAAGANKLAFGVQPSTTSAGSAINPAVTVIVQDQYGNTVTSDSSTVTISSGTTAFTGSTLTATASSGVATFSNIKPTTSGTSNTLTASDGSLTGVTSNTFTVNKATPTITFGTAPTPTYLGGTFTVSASTNNTDSSTLTYSYVSGPCAFVSGSTFSSSGAGTCIVQASGAATSNFNAASAQQNVAIAKATPTISVSNSPVIYNGAAQAATFTGSVGGTVSNVKYGGSSTMPTNAGTYAVTANFTPTDTTNYSSLSSASAGNFVINNPVPTTSSISPSSKTVGAAQFTMNVTGTNFVSGSVVQFNGSNRATTYLNATALSATILTSDLTTVGTFNITVFNPAPGGGYSNNQTFTLTVTSTYSLDTTYTFTETNSSSTWQSISIKDSSYADALANVSILNFTSGRWESILTNPFTGGTSPGEHVNVIKGASGNASNYDAGGGQIKIRYNWTNSTSNNSLGVDMINVTVLYSQPNFLLNITTNTTSVPVDNQYYLEINYSRDANETYSIYVWNGSAWNNRTTLNATPGNWTVMNYTLNSGENNSGKPLIRYLDNNPSGTSQGNIYIDYQRIHGITAGLPSNYYLNITTNTTNVPQAYSAELQLKYNIFGDNFTVQIMNTSSGWENVTILNATGMPYRNITLNSSWLIPDGTFSGNVASINRYYVNVRYLDVNQSVNGTLYLDYQRIYNV